MRLATLAAAAVFATSSFAGAALDAGALCEQGVAKALRKCITKVGVFQQRCYADTGAACAPGAAKVATALAKASALVADRCPDSTTVASAGYGPLLGPAALVDRVHEACLGEVASISARTYGGPHAAVLAGADTSGAKCLHKAHKTAVKQVARQFRTQAACIKAARKGTPCNVGATTAKVAALEAKSATKLGGVCEDLAAAIGLDPSRFAARASVQARCAVATAHVDPGPLSLDCGPRSDVVVPPRGVWTQVVLDEATFGSRCGDGSPYAFWLRVAPDGSPPERVLFGLQGGGVCLFGGDCASTSPDLFEALSETAPGGGYLSTDPAVNPFHDWTLAFLPYCTQDVFIGGGITNVFVEEGVTVHRFGAVNTRATLRYVRDVLWSVLDATTAEGFRPDRLRVLFGGTSAGGFGVAYNYHYLLDDLRWLRTTAVPDSGLALDNGQALGVRSLGLILNAESGPLAWGTVPFQPPYCVGHDCAVVLEGQALTAPRLLAVPEQRILNVSNQVDTTQVNTTFFSSIPAWTNALRAAHCTTRGLPGINFFLPAETQSIHTMLGSTSRFTTLAAGGETIRDWLAASVADPGATTDRVDEGTLVADRPGTLPFPCGLASPSGAFLD